MSVATGGLKTLAIDTSGPLQAFLLSLAEGPRAVHFYSAPARFFFFLTGTLLLRRLQFKLNIKEYSFYLLIINDTHGKILTKSSRWAG
jgi:hypothetical protein